MQNNFVDEDIECEMLNLATPQSHLGNLLNGIYIKNILKLQIIKKWRKKEIHKVQKGLTANLVHTST